MTKFFLILLTLSAGQILGQKADTAKVNFIFGCSCCADTLHDLADKRKIYVLTDNETELIAYKSGKKKWSILVHQTFSDKNTKIECMEFYEVNKKLVLRLFTNKEPKNHVDINPKNGHLLTKDRP